MIVAFFVILISLKKWQMRCLKNDSAPQVNSELHNPTNTEIVDSKILDVEEFKKHYENDEMKEKNKEGDEALQKDELEALRTPLRALPPAA